MPRRLEYFAGSILIVEDDRSISALIETILRQAGYANITCLNDPREAMSTYVSLRPDLLILDMLMPHVGGGDILELINPIAAGDVRPILVLTADHSTETKERALALGATDFLQKPFDPTELTLRTGNLLHMRALHKALRDENAALEILVADRTSEIQAAQTEMIDRLSRAAERRDDFTGEHTRRVGLLATEVASALGAPQELVDAIRLAAPLHDIGKIAVPDHILLKPSFLTEGEREIIERHSEIGAEILQGSWFPVLQLASEIALTHHERWDGNGYPNKLERDEIPLAGRIVSVCDAFDAMTNERPYRLAWPVDHALIELERCTGAQFDPAVVETVLDLAADGLFTSAA